VEDITQKTRKWEDNIKMELKEIFVGVNWISLAQGFCVHGYEPSSIAGGLLMIYKLEKV
jgi:hypothetical protein